MATHPYIPLYVDDFDAATPHLSAEEDGVYNRLLRLSWRTPGCSLPVDDTWIARKIRLSTDDFERVARPLLDEFFTVSRGRYVQRRLKREYDTISRKKTARKLAGKKGGEAKALKVQEKSPSNATDLPAHVRASPEPYPEPEPEKESKAIALGARRGGRLSATWAPTVEDTVFAVTQGFSEFEVVRMGERFRDYWVARPGREGVKLDWRATWRNWVRREAETRAARRPEPKRVGFV